MMQQVPRGRGAWRVGRGPRASATRRIGVHNASLPQYLHSVLGLAGTGSGPPRPGRATLLKIGLLLALSTVYVFRTLPTPLEHSPHALQPAPPNHPLHPSTNPATPPTPDEPRAGQRAAALFIYPRRAHGRRA